MDDCPKFLEDEYSWKLRICRNDLIVKLIGGTALGYLAKCLFTQGRKWPVFVAIGFAVGMAAENCKRELNVTMTPCIPNKKTKPS
ncbi:hypothetical protein O3M35_008809 [Rhynocoris fuscipes]|uniref:MICOS complex subunit MIC10 n=1 Tax=Rhynocoris fuscipes TaxID=488301 RepID=A0AAW1DEX9_9HEMI